MLFLFGWLVLAGYLLNKGYTFWGNVVLWGGLVLIICIAVSSKKKQVKVRAQEETREWMQEADRDEEEDYILYGSIFDDDDD